MRHAPEPMLGARTRDCRSQTPRSHYEPAPGRLQAAKPPKWTFIPCAMVRISGEMRRLFRAVSAASRAAPSRMSRSDTSISSRSNSRIASTRMIPPATIVGARSGCRPVTWRRSASGRRGQLGEDPLAGGEREPVPVHALAVVGVERAGRSRRTRSACRPPRCRRHAASRTSRGTAALELGASGRAAGLELVPAWAGRCAGGARCGAPSRAASRRRTRRCPACPTTTSVLPPPMSSTSSGSSCARARWSRPGR